MLKGTSIVFKLYLAMLEYFSEYLSGKYSVSSLDSPNHYKTNIIQKIVRMFHTLDELTNKIEDEVSARCVLRGILDSVTTYCFIYEREDKSDMLFRHYLYALDGLTTYKKAIVDGVLEDGSNKTFFEYSCNMAIVQLRQALYNHPYTNLDNKNIETIIKNHNWKYESIDKPNGLSFYRMYREVLLDEKLVNYYSGILSQYAHGLCLSNNPCVNQEQIRNVLYESILLADRIVKGIYRTFPQKEIVNNFLHSESYKRIMHCQGGDHDELLEYAQGIMRGDKIIYI